jgi:hypothetical protein
MKKYIIQFAILLVGLVSTNTTFADVKIKTRQTANGQSSEYTTYIKGKRERTEQNNGGYEIVNITQCDLRRSVQVIPQAKVYMLELWDKTDDSLTTKTLTTDDMTTQTVTQKGGLIMATTTVKDTGERKQMFGYTARHIITKTVMKSSPDACTQMSNRMEHDGWYIDAAFAFDCLTERY